LRDASPAQLRFVSRLFAAAIGALVVLACAIWLVGRIVGG
jgi:hypothetical protein